MVSRGGFIGLSRWDNFGLVPIVNYPILTILTHPPKDHLDLVAYLDFIRIAIGDLSGQARAVLKLHYCENIWRLVLESICGHVYNRVREDLASALESVGFQLAHPSAVGTDGARREEDFVAVAAARTHEVVAVGYLSPETWDGHLVNPP
jgi:hypothetical protein